jgi:hypothetical protein
MHKYPPLQRTGIYLVNLYEHIWRSGMHALPCMQPCRRRGGGVVRWCAGDKMNLFFSLTKPL